MKLNLIQATNLILVTKDTVTTCLQGVTQAPGGQYGWVTPVDVQTCPPPCKARGWRWEGADMAQGSVAGGQQSTPGPTQAKGAACYSIPSFDGEPGPERVSTFPQ